jgi:hypothetical protein
MPYPERQGTCAETISKNRCFQDFTNSSSLRAVPELRAASAMRTFNTALKQCDWELEEWRATKGARYDYSLLDRRGNAGWDLACKLVCRRNGLNRGRLSASAALRHRFFLPEF